MTPADTDQLTTRQYDELCEDLDAWRQAEQIRWAAGGLPS